MIFFLLLSALAAMPVQAGNEVGTHFEEYTVRIHQLHVNVVDKNGNPVSGLNQDDFIVKFNGKEQTVTSVYPISLDYEVTEEVDEAMPQHGRRLFVFVFDLQYSSGKGLFKARRDVAAFIAKEMLPADLAGVFTISNRNIRMVSNFTGDKQQLLKAVTTFGFSGSGEFHQTTGYAVVTSDEKERVQAMREAFGGLSKSTVRASEMAGLALPGGKYGGGAFGDIMVEVEHLSRESDQGTAMAYMDRFEEFARMLAVVKGRKNLILFSAGFRGGLATGEAAGTSPLAKSSHAFASSNVLSSAEHLIKALQGSGTVVFAMDTSQRAGTSRAKSNLETLNNLASSTGGRLFANVAQFDQALEQVKSATNRYYLVNVSSDLELPAGETASVKVKVRRPKTRAFTSKRIMLHQDYAGLSELERKLMLSDYIGKDILSQAIPFSMKAVPIPVDTPNIPINVFLEIQGDYFLRSGNLQKPAGFEVMVVAVDRKDQSVADQSYRTVSFVPEKVKNIFEKTGMKYFANLNVPAGSYKIKTILRDLENGQVASVIQEVDVSLGTKAVAGPLRISEQPWLVLQQDQAPIDDPFTFDQTRFVPSTNQNLVSEQTAHFLFLVDPRQAQRQPSISIRIIDAAGVDVATPASAVSLHTLTRSRVGPAGLLLRLDLTRFHLKAGEDYTLLSKVTVGDTPPVRSNIAFSVAGQL